MIYIHVILSDCYFQVGCVVSLSVRNEDGEVGNVLAYTAAALSCIGKWLIAWRVGRLGEGGRLASVNTPSFCPTLEVIPGSPPPRPPNTGLQSCHRWLLHACVPLFLCVTHYRGMQGIYNVQPEMCQGVYVRVCLSPKHKGLFKQCF